MASNATGVAFLPSSAGSDPCNAESNFTEGMTSPWTREVMHYCHGSAPLQAWALQEPEGKKAVQNNGAEMAVLQGNGEMIVASEKQSISLSPLWQ